MIKMKSPVRGRWTSRASRCDSLRRIHHVHSKQPKMRNLNLITRKPGNPNWGLFYKTICLYSSHNEGWGTVPIKRDKRDMMVKLSKWSRVDAVLVGKKCNKGHYWDIWQNWNMDYRLNIKCPESVNSTVITQEDILVLTKHRVKY